LGQLIDYYWNGQRRSGLIYFVVDNFALTSAWEDMLGCRSAATTKSRLKKAECRYTNTIARFRRTAPCGHTHRSRCLCEKPVAASSAFFFTKVDMPPGGLEARRDWEIVKCFALAANESKRAVLLVLTSLSRLSDHSFFIAFTISYRRVRATWKKGLASGRDRRESAGWWMIITPSRSDRRERIHRRGNTVVDCV
jgi:hypothetical protein